MCKRVKTGCFVELWTTRRLDTVVEISCAKQEYMLRTWVPKFCTKEIVRKSPSGHLLEKNQELTWWPKKRSWLPPSSFWTTKTAVSNMKVNGCKAESNSIFFRYARSLCQNNSLRGNWNLKHMGWFSEHEGEKNHSNSKNERFLTSFMYTRTDRVLCRCTIFQGI